MFSIRTTFPGPLRVQSPDPKTPPGGDKVGKRLADRSYPLAERFEVQEAEQAVNGAARQLQSGECDWSAWTQVLQDYEDVWMVLLDELRGARTKRHAA